MLSINTYQDITAAYDICEIGGTEVKTFSFVVDGLVIDTGTQSRATSFEEFFRTQTIEQVAITHNHEDHAGNAPWIQKNLGPGVPIFLHPGSIPEALTGLGYPQYRHDMWGDLDIYTPTPMPEKIITSSGKYTFEPVDSPGHTRFHNVFYEKNRGWLFSGDLYLGTKAFVCLEEENMTQTIATLQKILELDFDMIFCSHAGIIENGKVRMQKRLNFFLELQKQVHELRLNRLTNHAIDKQLFPFDLPITEISDGEWSSYNIIRSL